VNRFVDISTVWARVFFACRAAARARRQASEAAITCGFRSAIRSAFEHLATQFASTADRELLPAAIALPWDDGADVADDNTTAAAAAHEVSNEV
jgi:hypothetical protein